MSKKIDAALVDVSRRLKRRGSLDWAAKSQAVIDACHPKQRAAVLDPGRRVSILCGRGAGKTTAVRARMILRMMNTPRAVCLFIATTRDQAIDLMWNPIKDIIEELGIRATFNETRLTCRLTDTGSTLRLVGADDKRQIEKYRGIPHHEVWIDEAASYPPQLLNHLINRIIAPRLGDYDGMLGVCGTPGHVLSGDFYDATRPGSDKHRPWEDRDKPEYKDWAAWSRHHWSLEDGAPHVAALAKLWAAALVEKAAQGWSDKNPVWLREYKGQWAADDTDHVFRYQPHDEEGNEWNVWDPVIDPVTRFAQLPDDIVQPQYVYAMDPGHTDPTALEIFAYSLQDPLKRLFHVYEFVARDMYLRKIAELLIGEDLDHEKLGGTIGVTGWPTGFVFDPRSLAGGYIEELRKVYGIHAKLADQREKFDSIELTNGDLVDGRIKIMKGSVLEDQMLNLQWVVDDYGRVTEDKRQRNDATDCLIYARREAHHLFMSDAPNENKGMTSPFEDSPGFSDESEEEEFDSMLEDGGDSYWG